MRPAGAPGEACPAGAGARGLPGRPSRRCVPGSTHRPAGARPGSDSSSRGGRAGGRPRRDRRGRAAPESPPQPAPAAPTSEPTRLLVGARLGLAIPNGLNPADPSFLVTVGVAYQLPLPKVRRRLGIFLDLSYLRPTLSVTRADPRLAGGQQTIDVVLHDVGFTLGAHYWQPLPRRFLLLGGAGAKLHLTRTIANATSADGNPLGQTTEQSTRFGVDLRLGVGYRIGPGAVVLQANFEWTAVDHLITGESANTSFFSCLAGYTLFL